MAEQKDKAKTTAKPAKVGQKPAKSGVKPAKVHDLSNDNMALWNRHVQTNPDFTRQVTRSGGFKITSIDAYRQIEEATEEWGPFGDQWGVQEAEWSEFTATDPLGDSQTLGKFTGVFFYPGKDGTAYFPMSATEQIFQMRRPRQGEAYVYIDDEWTKKAFTNALTKALSYLGFNADVFMGLFDDNRYVQQRRLEEAEAQTAGNPARVVADTMGDEITQLAVKVTEYATKNAQFISAEAMQAMPTIEANARSRPNGFNWLTEKYNQLISAVEKRKAEAEAGQQTFEDDLPVY